MTAVWVASQAELDQALADGAARIIIDSTAGVWLVIRGNGHSHVEARGSSHVVARGSSHGVAWGSSHVEARDSSRVVARGSSRVVAWGSSHVEAQDSSHVEARDSSRVVAWGSSHVEARESSHVEARDSSHVEARDSSHVEAWESSHVEAGQHVAVHLYSQQVTLSGGVVIDLTALDLTDPIVWLAHSGVSIEEGGQAVVYKAVSDNWQTARGAQWTYEPGATVTADDWAPTAECGQGLHFGVTPSAARAYHRDATRYVACEITVAESVPLGDKIKARSCRVLHEVTIDGERVDS